MIYALAAGPAGMLGRRRADPAATEWVMVVV